MTTSIGKVRGLGSAKEGTEHFLEQRMTAGANILLMTWLLASLVLLPGFDFAIVSAWLGSAWAAVPMILLIVSVFWHFRLGLQTVIEDYQHDETRIVLLVALNYATTVGVVIALFAILRIAFTGIAANG